MSNNESLDEETKRILTEVDSNDSKESNNPKKSDKKDDKKYNDGTEWETNDRDTADSEW